MKRVIVILAFVLAAFFSSNAQGLTYPQNIQFNNSGLSSPGNLGNVPLTGQYLYVNDGVFFYQVNIMNPATINTLYNGYAVEGDFDDKGILYFVDDASTDSRLYKIDLETGVTTFIANLNGPLNLSYGYILSMSFYNGKMYATFSSTFITDIFIINLSNGSCSKVNSNPIPGFFTVLAIDKDGRFFGIEANENRLYRINPNSGTRSLIGDTGIPNTYVYCDADFNYNDGKLYFTGPIGSYIINTISGGSTYISPLSGFMCAVGAISATPVPFSYIYVILIFILIGGTIIARKFFF